jgi:predicted esterase
LENGVPRFFRRFGEGIFDEDDLRRPNELADFVEEARAHYGIASPIALGYSNGAAAASAGGARGRDLAEGDGSIVANAAGRLDGQGSLDCLGYE